MVLVVKKKVKMDYERTGIEHDDGFNYWLKDRSWTEKELLKNL